MIKRLEQIKEQIQNKKMTSRFVIYLGVVGMALILLSELFPVGKQTEQDGRLNEKNIVSEDATLTTTTISTEETYRANLEAKLTALIARMEGAGETAVMITLVSSEENIYAQDIIQNENQLSKSYVLLESGEALTQAVLTPEVCGVAVLCQGGNDITVVSKITALVSALFNISSNRVSVEKLQ